MAALCKVGGMRVLEVKWVSSARVRGGRRQLGFKGAALQHDAVKNTPRSVKHELVLL